jgi:cytochrome c551/c552
VAGVTFADSRKKLVKLIRRAGLNKWATMEMKRLKMVHEAKLKLPLLLPWASVAKL